MEELSIEIKGRGDVKGIIFKQIAKSEKAYVYERTDSEGNNDGYETFRRKINKKFGCESYPGSKSFGIWAWCFNSIDKAMAKFDYINNKYEK